MTNATIIEDDMVQAQLLQAQLKAKGIASTIIDNFDEADELIRKGLGSDIVLLDYDLGSGHGDGIDLCRMIRENSAMPVIVLTGHHASDVAVDFLNAGASQFLYKPYLIETLLARMDTSMRQTQSKLSSSLSVTRTEQPVLDFNRMQVQYAGVSLSVPEMELELFELLLANEGQTVYRDDINYLLGAEELNSRYADLLVTRLRRRLAVLPGGFRIKAIRGDGYMLLRRQRCSDTAAPAEQSESAQTPTDVRYQ